MKITAAKHIKRGATKKKPVPKTRSTRKKPAKFTSTLTINWFWLVSGILIGLIIMTSMSDFVPKLAFNFKNRIGTNTNTKVAVTTKKTNKQSKPATKKKNMVETKFDFYNVLPKDSNLTNKKSAGSNTRKNTLSLKKPKSTIYQYSIQAGSFRKLNEADALKANLVLNGFEAKIEAVKVNRKQTWYRVIVGPFNSREHAVKQQGLLEANNIEGTIVLKHAKHNKS